MRSGTADVADRKTRKIRRHSPSREEASDGGGLPLKKGPWTSAEDAILVEYVTKHGEGNWNAVQKHSGLARCGKSCRLRWANHLRPDLKKGAFSPEEERLIIELHAKMGNKWARMAAELPGRTDNEIKNYWNTRIKRLQRTGMPIYPSEVCLQVGGGIQESQDAGSMHAAVKNKSDLLQADDFEIPDVGFKKLEVDQGFSPLWSSFFEVPPFSAIREEICPSDHYGFPSMHPSKRIRESGVLLPVCNGASGNGIISSFGPYCEYSPENISDPFVMSLPYDANPNSCDHSPFDVLPGSHAFVNGNNPSSEPHLGAMKSELPSLQYVETQQSSCDTPASPRPSFESVDPLIQSPPTEQFQSDCPSPRSSGLLEAVIYEACTLKGPWKNSFEEIKDVNGNVACNSCPTPVKSEQEVFTYSDSPLGHHAASVFSECTPVSGSSFDEPLSVGPMLGCNIQARENSEPFSGIVQRQEILDHIEFCRPDALLDFGWFGHDGQPSKDVITRADYAGPLDGDSNGGQPANQML